MVGSGAGTRRLRADIEIRGVPHGIGFRPYVFRLARACRVDGSVSRFAGDVLIRASGPRAAIEEFMYRLSRSTPVPGAVMRSRLVSDELPHGFRIDDDVAAGAGTVSFDRATCGSCLSELRDPYDRRFRYAFTSCVDCGPRLSIVTGLPYGRARMTMDGFRLCSACAAEYADPAGRHFRAEAIACPKCGPRLVWRPGDSGAEVHGPDALGNAVSALTGGGLIAVKAPGGYRVYADAAAPKAVERLRRFDPRPSAVLAPYGWEVPGATEAERIRMSDVDAPVVMVRSPGLIADLAPGHDEIGVQRPYAPLLHLLADDAARPLAFTSGRVLVVDDEEAVRVFAPVVDGILAHDQPIANAVPDAVLRLESDGTEQLQRAGRGSPMPLSVADGSVIERLHALVVATAAEHDVPGPFLGVAYDAPGPGADGTFWGGELLLAGHADFIRVGRFAYAPMPGGRSAAEDPVRLTLGYLFGLERLGDRPIEADLVDSVTGRLDGDMVREVRRELDGASLASSAGMLYEAMSALLGLHEVDAYPGEGADLVAGIACEAEESALPWRLTRHEGLWVYDPTPTLRGALTARAEGMPVDRIAASFENTLVEVTVAMVNEVARKTMIQAVCLGGSVFTHRRLTSRMLAALKEQGYGAFVGRRTSCAVGGEEYGRAVVAAARRRGR